MRLHSVRFKRAPYSHGEDAERADLIRDLCSIYGCYLERAYVLGSLAQAPHMKWIARYVE